MNRVINSFTQSVLKRSLILTIPTYYWYRKQVKHKYITNTEFTPKITALRRALMSENRDNSAAVKQMCEYYEQYLVRIMSASNYVIKKGQIIGNFGKGTGILTGHMNYIITNYHVVTEAPVVYVSTFYRDIDGDVRSSRSVEAIIVYTDPSIDLALLTLRETGGEIGVKHRFCIDPKAGQWVVSVGHAGGIDWSLCDGVIRNEQLVLEHHSEATHRYYMSYLDPDKGFVCHTSPISTGFSGGLLLDTNGRIVGINKSGLPGYEIYFAISSNDIIAFFSAGLKYERDDMTKRYTFCKMKFLGITVRTEGPRVYVRSLLFPQNNNEFGINDRITKFNDKHIVSLNDLIDKINECEDNEYVFISVIRWKTRRAEEFGKSLKSLKCALI